MFLDLSDTVQTYLYIFLILTLVLYICLSLKLAYLCFEVLYPNQGNAFHMIVDYSASFEIFGKFILTSKNIFMYLFVYKQYYAVLIHQNRNIFFRVPCPKSNNGKVVLQHRCLSVCYQASWMRWPNFFQIFFCCKLLILKKGGK